VEAVASGFSQLPTGDVESPRERLVGDVGLASAGAWMLGIFGVGFSTEIVGGQEMWVEIWMIRGY